MPPSSDQDTSNTTSGSPATNNNNHKLSQKHSAGLQIPSKNGKKNGTAKEGNGGGVLAAVTKNASRLSNKSSIMPKSQSPKMLPVTSTSNGNPVTSPLLDQLASAALPSSSTQNTNEWAKNVPAYSSSPSNLINLGESPPTLPSSYEDRVANFGGWSTREQRIPNSYNPSASPPVGRRRPLSYQPDSSPFQPGTEDQPFQMSPYGRRTSMYSQSSRYPLPPLPHQPQAHFYGIPDVNHILSPRGPGLTPGENGFYCGFDNLPAQDPSKSPDNVLVTGYEGGFNVYVVHKRGLERTVNIDGLRGGVYNAKVIPWTVRGDSSIEFPLIAVVIHGPASISSVSSGEYAVASSDGNSVRQSDSVRGSPRLPQSIPENEPNVADYQTSVEVYSLNTKKLITTLLSGPKAPATVSNYSQIVAAPPPVGSLTIHADNGNLVVASGTTGETWIFRQGDSQGGQVHFRCIGKIWTTVQQGLPMSAAGVNGTVDGDWNSTETSSSSQQKHYKSSILSLNGRWLAYCPATPSSQISLRAAVPSVSGTAKVSGLNAQAPPQLPQVNCQVETPGGESMIGKIAQVATQEAIKGAAYVGRQGMQAWNNYWNKSTLQPTNGQHAYNPNLFPPTHGVAVPAPVVNKDPGLISILDLDALAQHNSSGPGSPHPLATFKVPAGCSFLSFSPSGLALFAANSNGDVQFVWDLMRLQHVKSSLLKGGFPGAVSQGPHVRQVARFTRMTIAKIVDVVWTKPHGERAAMVTEHGTVHILDLPASAFTWPPPRRRVTVPSSKDATAGNEPSTMPLSAAAAGVASSTISTLWNVAQPLVRTRRSSSGVTNSTATIASTQAGHGTQAQALKANISRSFGAATGRMNEMRKSSGKQVRVHLPQSPTPPGPACVRLASGRHHDLVIVIGNGIVRIYNIKSRRADRPADKQKASQGAKFVEHRVPSLPDQKVVPDNLSNLHLDDNFDNSDRDNEELRWAPRQTKGSSAVHSGTESSIPQAEIESNAPYQPFHTDRRVGLYIRSCVDVTPHSPSVSALLAPQSLPSTKDYKDTKLMSAWAFGGPIKAVKLDVGPRPMTEDEYDDPFDHRALPSSAIQRQLRVTDSSDGIDQIVVTTRIRHGARSRAGNGDIDEEGFFEDDCEVLDFASQRV